MTLREDDEPGGDALTPPEGERAITFRSGFALGPGLGRSPGRSYDTGPVATAPPFSPPSGPRLTRPSVLDVPQPRNGRPRSATEPTLVPDAALAAAAPTNPTAFAAIYRRYGDALYSFCLGMLRDPDAAADCVQEVFCTAATRLGQLREHDKLRPWLYAIARHEALARLRHRRREEASDELPDGPNGAEGPEARIARSELAALIAEATGGLSDRDRAVLALHYHHDLDGPALADALGVSATNANTLVSRLRTTIERSVGAVLVARHRRQECTELAGLLEGWDGRMTVLIRKRIARHIDHCAPCVQARRELVSPQALLRTAPGAVPVPGWLSESVLRAATPLLQGTSVVARSWWPAPLGGSTPTTLAILAPIIAAVIAVPLLAGALLAGPIAPAPPVAALPTGTEATTSRSVSAPSTAPTSSPSNGPTTTTPPVGPSATSTTAPGFRPRAVPGELRTPVRQGPLGPFRRTPLPEGPQLPDSPPPPQSDPGGTRGEEDNGPSEDGRSGDSGSAPNSAPN